MKFIQKIALFVFVATLTLFFALPFIGTYELNREQFNSVVIGWTDDGTKESILLEKEFESIFDQTYTSNFSFVSAIDGAIKKANQPYIDANKWEKVVKSNYTYSLTKVATSGFLKDSSTKLILFILCFLICPIAAFFYYSPSYLGTSNGIKNNGIYHSKATNKGWIALLVFAGLVLFYILLYFTPQYITNWVVLTDPLAYRLTGSEGSQWFLYGFMYCTVMMVMGIRMLLKYRGNNYQLIRTSVVLFFQIVFAFLLPNLVKELHGHDIKNIWPLDYGYFEGYQIENHLGTNAPISATAVYIWGIALFLIGVPVFTYYFGKRWYCSWVCGCGGLAETLGDPYRQLSSKKLSAWKFERILIHGILIFAFIMTLMLILGHYGMFDNGTAGFVKYIYGFAIGSVFSGVIGTGFYPVLGSRVWCRFGCPLAAYIGLWQRKASKFRITTNGGQCISCGNCSTYCEMGIDVRAYAQKGQNIVRSSCVGCGVCSSVCPRGVLKLENGPTEKRIIDNPVMPGLVKQD